jgi:hypothetical protein
MKAVLIAAVLSLLVTGTASAQVQRDELRLALVQLQRAVDALRANRPAGLGESVQWLRGRIEQTDPGQVSPQYLRSLTDAARLLGAAPTPLVIEDIAEDLAAKVEHCRALGIGMGGSVRVRVNTRRGSQVINNWQVFSLLKFYERAGTGSALAFPTLSAPAETRLDPGRYWLWARDPATGRISERSLLKISGKQEFSIDLPVP